MSETRFMFWDTEAQEYLPYKTQSTILVFRGIDDFFYENWAVDTGDNRKNMVIELCYHDDEYHNEEYHEWFLEDRRIKFNVEYRGLRYLVIPPAYYDTKTPPYEKEREKDV